MPLVVGVDSSTQSTKVEARDLATGTVVATASAPHPATTPPVSEQHPEDWWQALIGALDQLGDRRGDVVAISVAGQQHGLVLLDEHDEPLRAAPLWNDTRSAAAATALVERLGAEHWARGCGSVPVAAFTIAKLAWLAETEPDLVARTRRVMLPHDYLTWRLSGAHVTDRGDASGTGWFDPVTNTYRLELLSEALPGDGAEPWADRLPQVLDFDAPAGALTAEAAAATGLPAGIVVGPGTGDNMAAALGLGLAPNDVALSLGTSGTIYSVSTKPSHDPSGSVAGFADASGRFLPLVCTLNATKVTDTVARWLGTDAPGLGELALAAPADTSVETFDGPTLIPYFDGERTPNRPDATGGFEGLRNTTTREALARAAHDGVLCGLFDGLDALRQAGVAADGTLHLIGGGSRSSAYRQRAADLHGEAIVVPDTDETVATGAALQAALLADPSGSNGSTNALATLSARWGLGAGTTVEPQADGSAVRAAYRVAVDGAA